jgi:uncharacterized protein HemX
MDEFRTSEVKSTQVPLLAPERNVLLREDTQAVLMRFS